VGVRGRAPGQHRLRFDSERDALTGLRNRRYFNEYVLSVDGAGRSALRIAGGSTTSSGSTTRWDTPPATRCWHT